MGHQIQYIHDHIKRSCFEDQFFKADVLFEDHLLVWLISGETRIVQADHTYVFGAGDVLFFPRYLLATVLNFPKNGLPHQSVTMHLTLPRLKDYYHKNETPVKPGLAPALTFQTFEQHPLLKSCLASLVPYFELKEQLPEILASLKIEEAIHVLRTIAPGIDQLLANFAEPGKIDIVNFMERNYMFNMPMEKFGYLTGRSLTTFKRDFKRAFQTTPQNGLPKGGWTWPITRSGKRSVSHQKFTWKPGLKIFPISAMYLKNASVMHLPKQFYNHLRIIIVINGPAYLKYKRNKK